MKKYQYVQCYVNVCVDGVNMVILHYRASKNTSLAQSDINFFEATYLIMLTLGLGGGRDKHLYTNDGSNRGAARFFRRTQTALWSFSLLQVRMGPVARVHQTA